MQQSVTQYICNFIVIKLNKSIKHVIIHKTKFSETKQKLIDRIALSVTTAARSGE